MVAPAAKNMKTGFFKMVRPALRFSFFSRASSSGVLSSFPCTSGAASPWLWDVLVAVLGRRTKRVTTMPRGMAIKPLTLIVHPKFMPWWLRSWSSIMGQMTPPKEEPAMVRPVARPLCLVKCSAKVETHLCHGLARRCFWSFDDGQTYGIVRNDMARPVSRPWARKNCQYSSQSEVMNIPSTTAVHALASNG